MPLDCDSRDFENVAGQSDCHGNEGWDYETSSIGDGRCDDRFNCYQWHYDCGDCGSGEDAYGEGPTGGSYGEDPAGGSAGKSAAPAKTPTKKSRCAGMPKEICKGIAKSDCKWSNGECTDR